MPPSECYEPREARRAPQVGLECLLEWPDCRAPSRGLPWSRALCHTTHVQRVRRCTNVISYWSARSGASISSASSINVAAGRLAARTNRTDLLQHARCVTSSNCSDACRTQIGYRARMISLYVISVCRMARVCKLTIMTIPLAVPFTTE